MPCAQLSRIRSPGTLARWFNSRSEFNYSTAKVKVIAGDIIPADGEVIAGVSVDESAITGESAQY